jgi:hypothetical protein
MLLREIFQKFFEGGVLNLVKKSQTGIVPNILQNVTPCNSQKIVLMYE